MKLLGQPLVIRGVFRHPADPDDPVVDSFELVPSGASLGVSNAVILRELAELTEIYERVQEVLEGILGL